MIKLIDLLNELSKPENIYNGGNTDPKDDYLQQGFRTKQTDVNPETGTISSKVEYLPSFEQVRRDLMKYRKEFQPFKYHSSSTISKNAKDLNTLLTKAANLVFVLDKMIELDNKR